MSLRCFCGYVFAGGAPIDVATSCVSPTGASWKLRSGFPRAGSPQATGRGPKTPRSCSSSWTRTRRYSGWGVLH